MDKKEVSRVLRDIGTLLELRGENPFKTRAYANAARSIETLADDLAPRVEDGSINQIKGIGKALAEKITELVRTGELAYYDELKASFPNDLLELLKVPNLGPKKTRVLWEKLGVESLGELEYACNENRLVELDGFGAKSQEKILTGIERLKRYRGSFHYSSAMAAARAVVDVLTKHAAARRVSLAGSLRRCRETTKEIDLVASSQDPAALMDCFAGMAGVERVDVKGETETTIILESGMSADLRVVTEEVYPFALMYLTGSKEHNAVMRSRAKAKGLVLNEVGLFDGKRSLACADEAAIFKALDLAYIPPELREDFGEFTAAEAGALPRLVEEADIRGVFHVHTTWSDGAASAEAMALRARELGYAYIGFSDHSKSAFYAHGLDEERLRRQGEELTELNEKLDGIRIFSGIESDILPDGSLDYADDVLAELDFVIGSIHGNFTMSQEEMTARIVRAVSNPLLTMLGHPTGRLLLARDAYLVDMRAVIDAAAEHGKIIEINASPHRLDLDWRLGQYAIQRGVRISINPDAHSLDGLADTQYGVAVARKAWLEPRHVFNTLDADEVAARLAT